MTGKLVFEERVTIPLDIDSLEAFRRWALSDGFPDEGRIDFVEGQIEIEMTPADLFTHGTVKTEIIVALGQRAKTTVPGDVFTDSTRISSVPGDVSAEPDIVFVSEECLRAGRVRLVAKSKARPDRYVEIDGAPDLVVEIASDASVKKDTERLPPAYFRAGISEYWLVDARGDELRPPSTGAAPRVSSPFPRTRTASSARRSSPGAFASRGSGGTSAGGGTSFRSPSEEGSMPCALCSEKTRSNPGPPADDQRRREER